MFNGICSKPEENIPQPKMFVYHFQFTTKYMKITIQSLPFIVQMNFFFFFKKVQDTVVINECFVL